MCDQQRLRSAGAYAQSDQSLYKSLEYFMSVKLLAEHHLEFLSLKGVCIGSPESTLVKILHCWKLHAMAHLYSNVFEILMKVNCEVKLRNYFLIVPTKTEKLQMVTVHKKYDIYTCKSNS